MGVVLGKSKSLTPKGVREIRHVGNIEKKGIELFKNIAKQFGEQSKKNKPKKLKVFFR